MKYMYMHVCVHADSIEIDLKLLLFSRACHKEVALYWQK